MASINLTHHHAASPTQNADNLCVQCRQLDLELLELNPGDDCIVRIGANSNCAFCSFLGASLWPSNEDFKQLETGKEGVDVRIWSAERDGAFPRGRLVASIDEQWYKSGKRVLIRLDSKNRREDSSPPFRVISEDSIDFALLQSWITNCIERHLSSCTRRDLTVGLRSRDTTGVRMIDCHTRKIVDANFLDVDYIALSYVWGYSRQEPLPKVRSTLGFPDTLPKKLPTTIEDAIKVVLQLNFSYLWVDSYCIDQSDPHEVQSQVMIMDAIYHAATLTICAAAGKHSDYGLPGVRSRPRARQKTTTRDGVTWAAASMNAKSTVKNSRWYSRGWTYQETFFSRRCLIFTEEQVIFECNAQTCCEQDPPDQRCTNLAYHPLLGRRSRTGQYVAGLLTDHILQYAMRDLTYPSDILKAMNGLFRSFANNREAWRQYWGIPVSLTAFGIHETDDDCSQYTQNQKLLVAISFGLSWFKFSHSAHLIMPEATRRHGFPSWSWCGWTGAPNWTFQGDDKTYLTDVPIRVEAQKLDGSRISLSEGLAHRLFLDDRQSSNFTYNLCLHAEVLDVEITYLSEAIHFPDGNRYQRTHYAVIVDLDVEPHGQDTPQQSRQLHWPLQVTPHTGANNDMPSTLLEEALQCVVISQSCGLIVRPVNDGVFERLGLIRVLARSDKGKKYPLYWGPHLRDYFPGSNRDIIIS